MAVVSAKKVGWELSVPYLLVHQTSMVQAVHIFVHVKRIILKDVIHGLEPVSVRLDGQERLVREHVLSTSMERNVLKVVNVEMEHSAIQLMAPVYVHQATMGHYVMNTVQSLNTDKNVSLTVGVIIHMAVPMSQESVSANQDGKDNSALSLVHLEVMERIVLKHATVSTMDHVIP